MNNDIILLHAHKGESKRRVRQDVWLFVDTKMSSLIETGQFMSSTYYVRVRNQASTCLTNESVLQEAKKSRLCWLPYK